MAVTGEILQNRYRILELLGQGGMSSVYKVLDLVLNRVVAVKERHLDPQARGGSLYSMQQQFLQEARTLANLSHPNLPRVTDYFTTATNEYLVMDYVEGQSLMDILNTSGAQPENCVLAWARQLLDALAYIHKQGVIHRDIKPANIRLRPDGQVVLVDFGLVKRMDPTNPMTQAVVRGFGTPDYAPLEQFGEGGLHTDARSDIFSLGATLYHLLTGRPPADVHARLLHPESFLSPQAINSRISSSTNAALLKALALQPGNRFQSAEAFAQALFHPRPAPAPPPAAVVGTATPPTSTARRTVDPYAPTVGAMPPISRPATTPPILPSRVTARQQPRQSGLSSAAVLIPLLPAVCLIVGILGYASYQFGVFDIFLNTGVTTTPLPTLTSPPTATPRPSATPNAQATAAAATAHAGATWTAVWSLLTPTPTTSPTASATHTITATPTPVPTGTSQPTDTPQPTVTATIPPPPTATTLPSPTPTATKIPPTPAPSSTTPPTIAPSATAAPPGPSATPKKPKRSDH